MAWTARLVRKRHRRNVQTLCANPLAEISGALGDLGTLLPLMAALAAQGSVSLSATLVWSGLCNVATGMLFGIPLPVQPMKAIAAAAIAADTPLRPTVAAGALVSAAVLLLAATGLLQWLAHWVPLPVVRGIQLGAGLSLVLAAGGPALLGGLRWLHPSALDNQLWALGAFLGLLLTQSSVPDCTPDRTRRLMRQRHPSRRTLFVPYALLVFLVGLCLAFAIALMRHDHHLPRFAFWHPHLVLPAWLSTDAWSMAVAQLPLTTLNSILAVSALADDLFLTGEDDGDDSDGDNGPWHSSVTAFGLSVGAMNLLGCWLGAMPVCHGAGGLAAQYRFGARSGASVVLLGITKIVLGLVLGETLVDLLRSFPGSILGVMVLAAGLELALAGADWSFGDVAASSRTSTDRRRAWTVLLVTVAGLLAFKNDAVGFVAGLLCHGAYVLVDRWAEEGGTIPQREQAPLLS